MQDIFATDNNQMHEDEIQCPSYLRASSFDPWLSAFAAIVWVETASSPAPAKKPRVILFTARLLFRSEAPQKYVRDIYL
jgi:hypothetical protein